MLASKHVVRNLLISGAARYPGALRDHPVKVMRSLGTSVPNMAVALQLCPPLQFGPLTYQPIEWVFFSNQSAL